MNPIQISGGGLAGCLLLAGLKYRWPNLSIQLEEQAAELGSSHTWSFHQHDIPKQSWPWLSPLISKTWLGYDVFFPKYQRAFNSSYHSIRAEDLKSKITTQFNSEIKFKCRSEINDSAFQAWGWPVLKKTQNFGYQKFVGLDLKLAEPHGLTRPILKDVRITQTDGYRFFYLLPWSETELLIEDTYYSNSPVIDENQTIQEIYKYAASKNYKIKEVQRREVGSLPLELYANEIQAHPLAIGAAAGLAHPVTGYTLPFIVKQVQAVLNASEPNLELWRAALAKENKILKKTFSYYRFLNRMMFLAAVPEKRFEVLQRFYTLPEGLIQRFYSAETNWSDELRVLIGKPPVPILKAFRQFGDRA
jgi:lycopene beta-cyclase